MAVETPPKVAEIIAGELKPSAARRRDSARSWALGIWSVLALLYLFIPIFVIIVFSFNDPKGRFNFTWEGFTLEHWKHPFSNPDLAKAMENSFSIALITTIIATALGTFMAMALVRYGFRGRGVVDFFVFLPLSTPEVVIGAALLALFLTASISTGYATIVIAHVMFTVSYVVVTVKARLEGMDRHIEEAAMDLGATEWTTFRKVTLPLIAPGVAAAALLAAAISVDDFVITLLQLRPDRHVPAVHLRRHTPGCATRGQRARDRAAADRAGAHVAQRDAPAAARSPRCSAPSGLTDKTSAQTRARAGRYRWVMRARWLKTLDPGYLLAAAAAAVPALMMAVYGQQKVALSSEAHFWPVVMAAGTAAVVAAGLTAAGVRARDGRVILLGTAFSTTTALLAVHGFATPGVIVGDERRDRPRRRRVDPRRRRVCSR